MRLSKSFASYLVIMDLIPVVRDGEHHPQNLTENADNVLELSRVRTLYPGREGRETRGRQRVSCIKKNPIHPAGLDFCHRIFYKHHQVDVEEARFSYLQEICFEPGRVASGVLNDGAKRKYKISRCAVNLPVQLAQRL